MLRSGSRSAGCAGLGLPRSSPEAGHGSLARGWFGPWLRAWMRFEFAPGRVNALQLSDPALQRVETTKDRCHVVRFLPAGFELELRLETALAGLRHVGIRPAADCQFGRLPRLDLIQENEMALTNRSSFGGGLGCLQLNFFECDEGLDETVDGDPSILVIGLLSLDAFAGRIEELLEERIDLLGFRHRLGRVGRLSGLAESGRGGWRGILRLGRPDQD